MPGRRSSGDAPIPGPSSAKREHRRVLVAILAAATAAGFVIFVVPQISGLGETLARLRSGSAWWLGLGVGFEAVSLVAYVALFRAVFSSDEGRIGRRASFQITFAGDVATKIFAAAGAGSVALTVCALRASGLWASFRAFGHAPPAAVLVLGYFVGTLGNALPLPGGIGGVEGGLIGAFLGFGVSGSLAVVAVLAYRAISYWLPTLPGLIAYVRLRGTVDDWRSSGEESAGGDEPPLPDATAAA